MSDLPEIDPALAHLYGDVGAGPAEPITVPVRTTDLDALVHAVPEVELVDDRDVTELAILLEARQAEGTSSDDLLLELGLGEYLEPDGPPADDVDLVFGLNALGRAVTRRLAERAGLIPRGVR